MKSSEELWDVIIIGGGASGMMAAGVAGSRGKKVLILEKNRSLGEKLKITGGGRCNITNAEYDIRTLLKKYGEGESFLYSPFSHFGVEDTFTYFEKRGLPLVVQARNRAFPHTEKATDVCAVMQKELALHHVAVELGCSVKRFLIEKNSIVGVETSRGVYKAKAYILATGGMSHPETGSTGDGFHFLSSIGHTIKKPTPTIVPLAVADTWVHALSGVSLSFMKITFMLDGKKAFAKTGKLLFTHFGISGPLILNSAHAVSELLESGIVTAKIDAYPDTNEKALEEKIMKVMDVNKNKLFRSILPDLIPLGLSDTVISLLPQVDFEKRVHSVSRAERKALIALLKAFPLTITHLMGYDRAVVADGGVMLSEIDTRTMQSKLFSNLYITGDLLHINRPSGGYSLQLCWTTGFVAGNAA